MQRILTQEEKKSKERFKQIIVGLVLIFIMVLSTLGYSLFNQEENNPSSQGQEKIVYNEVEFIKTNDFWVTNIEGKQFIFKYNPNETERFNSQLKSIGSYYDEPLYVSSKNKIAISEIYNNLNDVVQRMQEACVEGEDCEGNFPTKDCGSNFMIIKESNMTKITQNKSCVYIEGSSENMIKLTDEFLFKILGITE